MNIFKNKKIGIWGFGIVGQSIYKYLQHYTHDIQIMDSKPQTVPNFILQTNQNAIDFFKHNDLIIPSPGINLKSYKEYGDKFISELDIFASEYRQPTIAITGSIGKTSITYLLSHCVPNSIAAGNIGYAMLNLITDKIDKKPIIELSSFQLQQSNTFAPDLAIWTNFYPNHLDYHKDEKEYFTAKCNIIAHQHNNQIALLPCDLIEEIKKTCHPKSKIYLTCKNSCKTHDYPTFSIKSKEVILNSLSVFHDLTRLAPITFQENWLVIIGALYLQNISLHNLAEITHQIPTQEHRLEKIKTIGNTTFYNDSKSTIWQTTKAALDLFDQKACALFLGGMSKGTDRTPLIQYLATKNITVYAFGAEAEIIQNLCDLYSVPCYSSKTLQDSVELYKQTLIKPDIVLLSPAGASFDLFKNYQERGNVFKELILKMTD